MRKIWACFWYQNLRKFEKNQKQSDRAPLMNCHDGVKPVIVCLVVADLPFNIFIILSFLQKHGWMHYGILVILIPVSVQVKSDTCCTQLIRYFTRAGCIIWRMHSCSAYQCHIFQFVDVIEVNIHFITNYRLHLFFYSDKTTLILENISLFGKSYLGRHIAGTDVFTFKQMWKQSSITLSALFIAYIHQLLQTSRCLI